MSLRTVLTGLGVTLVAASAHALPVVTPSLQAGDLAFTSFNADEDSWALVTFVDLAANSTIYFSDNEWNGTAFIDSNEHALAWNTGASTIAAGTVVTFTEIDATPDVISASIGNLTLAGTGGSNLGFAKSDETVYAFVGSAGNAPTTFITALTTENDSKPTYVSSTGLTVGTNAIALVPDADFGEYTGARSGLTSLSGYRSLINNAGNWNDVGSGEFTGQALNATPFTVTPVPEPGTYALMLAGLGAIGAMVRRRKA